MTSTCKDHNLCPLISFFLLSPNIYMEASRKICFCVFPPSIARTPNALPKKEKKKTKKDRETLSSSSTHSLPLPLQLALLHTDLACMARLLESPRLCWSRCLLSCLCSTWATSITKSSCHQGQRGHSSCWPCHFDSRRDFVRFNWLSPSTPNSKSFYHPVWTPTHLPTVHKTMKK